MKISIKQRLILFALIPVIAGCNDKGDNNNNPPAAPVFPRFFEVKKIDCESNVELCNRKPGLKFTALAPLVQDNWRLELRVSYQPDPYTLTICCDTIPRLIDSLKMMQETLENFRRDKPERAEKTCQLPDGITITVFYSKDLAGTGEYSAVEFGKVSDGSVFYVYTKQQFDDLFRDINERFRTCCLE
jgi:hypothetical protein